MGDAYHRITRVVMGANDGSDGIWLDDGSRLVVGNYDVTTRAAIYGQPAMHMITIRVSGDIDVQLITRHAGTTPV